MVNEEVPTQVPLDKVKRRPHLRQVLISFEQSMQWESLQATHWLFMKELP